MIPGGFFTALEMVVEMISHPPGARRPKPPEPLPFPPPPRTDTMKDTVYTHVTVSNVGVETALEKLVDLRNEATAILNHRSVLALDGAIQLLDGLARQIDAARPEPDPMLDAYTSPCASNYNTVVGYLAKRGIYSEDLGLKHGWRCANACRKRGIEIAKVDAPEALKAIGIEKVNAYPVDILDELLSSEVD